MFSLIWRFLPGPAWLRVIVILGVAAVLVYALVTWVYPYAAGLLMSEEATVSQ